MTSINIPGIGRLTPEQIENSIKLDQAKHDLLVQRRAAWLEFGRAERALHHTAHFDESNRDSNARTLLTAYLQASKSWYEAQAQLYEVEIAEAKSKVAVQQALLEEARKPNLFVPPPSN